MKYRQQLVGRLLQFKKLDYLATEAPWESAQDDAIVHRFGRSASIEVAETDSIHHADEALIIQYRNNTPHLVRALQRVLEIHMPPGANMCGVCAWPVQPSNTPPSPCPTAVVVLDALKKIT